MDRLFYSLLTAFFVGVDGSIHVLLIPNSRLSRKVAKNPLIIVFHSWSGGREMPCCPAEVSNTRCAGRPAPTAVQLFSRSSNRGFFYKNL